MKRIFFLLYSMSVGGVEKALLELLSIIPLDEYDVHVGLIRKKGEFLDFIPSGVKIHEVDCYANYWRFINDPPMHGIKQMLRKGHLRDAIVQTLLYLHYRLTSNRYLFYKYILRKEPVFSEEFDLAVSFAGPSLMVDYYICEKVKAAKKCGWIHFDVSKFIFDRKMIAQLYEKFDRIFIVSEQGKRVFDNMFPQFVSKTMLFHNVVSPEQVIHMSQQGPSFDDCYDGKRILTVGRISEEKGQQVAIEALKLLLDKGFLFKWYFVGDGTDRENCKQLAEDYGIGNQVVFLGTQTNPYGYMKNCDIYVQPSRHEGFCITLAEAMCFNRPIVATNFTGALEQLQDRENGFVVGMSAGDIAKGVIAAMDKGPIDTIQVQPHNDLSKLLELIP